MNKVIQEIMKIRKSIYIGFFFIILICYNPLFSQIQKTKLAEVRIDSIIVFQPDSIQFELSITRTADNWDSWANGTFQIGINDSNFRINSSNIQFAYIPGTTEIPNLYLDANPGGQVPDNEYTMTPRIFNDRISITIIGPEEYSDCEYFERDARKEIGKFVLKSNIGTIPWHRLIFKRTNDPNDPYFHYQALAYKTENPISYNSVKWYDINDNVEMNNAIGKTYAKYIIDFDMPAMILDTFYAAYAGQKKDTLVWITSSEPIHKGFILTRKLVKQEFASQPYNDPYGFPDTVGKWNTGLPIDEMLIGNIEHMSGHEYRYEFDTVPYRDETYCYELIYQTLQDELITLDTACIPIPDVLIFSADNIPNPFSEKTTVRFRLEEEAIVDCIVYDIEGRVVTKLIEGQIMHVGLHHVDFNANIFAPQGLYDILIVAVPTEDMPIKIGRSVIKAQLLR
jgi:hypothetical protein